MGMYDGMPLEELEARREVMKNTLEQSQIYPKGSPHWRRAATIPAKLIELDAAIQAAQPKKKPGRPKKKITESVSAKVIRGGDSAATD